MKKLLKINIVLIIGFCLTMTGCKDDFLVQDNPNAISPATFWNNIQDLNYGLNAVYDAFSNGNSYRLVDELARSDYSWANGWQRPNNTNIYYQQTFNEASDANRHKWANLYTTIFRANQVIAACEDLAGTHGSEDTEEDANLVLAQARWHRAYAYFNLHNHFNNGQVIIWDEVPTSETGYYKAVSSSQEVLDFYRADLEFAEANLPSTWLEDANDDSDLGRVTSGSAVALLGQSYLFDGDFATASTYFKRVIDNYGYALTPHPMSNMTTYDELNEESIIEIIYTLALIDGKSSASTANVNQLLTGKQGWWGGVASNWLIQEYRNDPLDFSDERNMVTLPDGSPGFRRYTLRTSYSVAIADDDDTPYYGFSKTGLGTNFNVKMTCFWRKHTNWDIGASEREVEGTDGTTISGVNERLLRLAEIYLNYAECQIELGNVDEAMLYINKVRRRAGAQLLGPAGSGEFPFNDHDNLTYDATSLREHLRHKEYPLELSCEGPGGDRSIDLRRWGIKKQRYQELAQREYVGTSFQMENDEGNLIWKWGALCDEVAIGDGDPDWAEFQEAAVNYNEALHAYWPLPAAEEIANPDLYNF
ncbi:RagB/SusD family nutrient uptake outer membrane protein [Seonamhaeicola maritimus]|nr:RagB/SusD family nutrient uptake outer membrane protein [Seonamhaeicola maritimus]